MKYIRNDDLVKSLYQYKINRCHKTEQKLFDYVKLMIDRISKDYKFSGYLNLHEDMKANALMYFSINLERGNIKVKKLKEGSVVKVKTMNKINSDKVYDEIREIIGKEVMIIKRVSDNEIIVKEVIDKIYCLETNNIKEYVLSNIEIILDVYYLSPSNAFSYITCIIEDSFWKIINDENFHFNKIQLFFNTSEKRDVNPDDAAKYDFTSDTNKMKVEKMRMESIEYENNLKKPTIRKKSIKLAINNLFDKYKDIKKRNN